MQEGQGNEIILLRKLPFGLVPGVYAVYGALTYAAITLGGNWIGALGVAGCLGFYAYHSTYKWLAGRLNSFVISDLLNEYKKHGTFDDKDCLIKYERDDNDQVH